MDELRMRALRELPGKRVDLLKFRAQIRLWIGRWHRGYRRFKVKQRLEQLLLAFLHTFNSKCF